MNARTVVQAKTSVVLVLGISLLVPMAISSTAMDLAEHPGPGADHGLCWRTGTLAAWASSSRSGEYVSNRDVYLSVTLAWVLAALCSGVPFLVIGTFDSFLDSRGGCLRGSAKVSPATGESSYCKSDALH